MKREDIISKMREAGLKAPARGDFIFIHWDQIAMLLDHERAAEREACAKVCEDAPEPDGRDLAERIRARGATHERT